MYVCLQFERKGVLFMLMVSSFEDVVFCVCLCVCVCVCVCARAHVCF